mmetsp:Transcript_2449/g.5809  ORF Transcript_2449/g.5809 Transcript_2449/m.5809 type:complete len:228 (+) Transcript_2449:4218-4901(+)
MRCCCASSSFSLPRLAPLSPASLAQDLSMASMRSCTSCESAAPRPMISLPSPCSTATRFLLPSYSSSCWSSTFSAVCAASTLSMFSSLPRYAPFCPAQASRLSALAQNCFSSSAMRCWRSSSARSAASRLSSAAPSPSHCVLISFTDKPSGGQYAGRLLARSFSPMLVNCVSRSRRSAFLGGFSVPLYATNSSVLRCTASSELPKSRPSISTVFSLIHLDRLPALVS